jgi:uncharacterized protein
MLRHRNVLAIALCLAGTALSQGLRPRCQPLDVAAKRGGGPYADAAMCMILGGDRSERVEGLEVLKIEAKKANDEAAYNLSSVLRLGLGGVTKDIAEGNRLLENLVAKGHVKAISSLGIALMSGFGMEQDTIRGETLLQEAAEKGDPGAQYNLVVEYRRGMRFPMNIDRSQEMFEKLALNPERMAATYLQHAKQFLEQQSGNEDRLKARAEAGDFQAQYYWGKTNLGLRKYDEARKWLQASADQDFAIAINDLGDMYDKALGVDRDATKAGSLYLRAAEKGFLPAQIRLGNKYFLGDGVEKSAANGLFWLKVAGLLGSEKADVNFNVEASQQPKEIVAAAQQKAAEYIRLHPEFQAQKDGSFRELRVFSAPTPASK